MKILNLYVDDYGWKPFEYEDISDLSSELKSRKIRIGDGTSIGSRTSIGYGTSIGDNLKIKALVISGTKHIVRYFGYDLIQIGCESHSIEWWLNNYELVGKTECYTEEQIQEYGNYIVQIAKMHELKMFDPIQL